MNQDRDRQETEDKNRELDDNELEVINGGLFSPMPNPINAIAKETFDKWLHTDEGPNILRHIDKLF